MLCIVRFLEYFVKDLRYVCNKYVFRQFLIGLAITIDGFLFGADLAFPATLVPEFQKFHNGNSSETMGPIIPMSEVDGIWFSSISSLSAAPATLLGVILVEFLGRKWSYVLGAIGTSIGWCVIATSSELWQLNLGRAIHGFHKALTISATFCFISEAASQQQRHRTFLFALINIGVALGIFFVDLTNGFHYWRTSSAFLSILSLLHAIILLCLRNTYLWYLQRGLIPEAKMAYFWYRKETNEEIIMFNKMSEDPVEKPLTTCHRLKQVIGQKNFVFPFTVMFWYAVTLACSGGTVLISQSVAIIKRTLSIDANLMTVFNDILRLAAALGVLPLLKQCSNRKLVNSSTLICGLSLFVVIDAIYWEDAWSGFSMISVIAVLLYTVYYYVGIKTMFTVCLGEFFAGCNVSLGVGSISFFAFVFNFAALQIVPIMFRNLGNLAALSIVMVSLALGGAGLYLMMPEIKYESDEVPIMVREDLRNLNQDQQEQAEDPPIDPRTESEA